MKIPEKWTTQTSWFVAAAIGIFFLAGYLLMLLQLPNRPFFIDEFVYIGRYLFPVLTSPLKVFWTIDTKQPLYFWIFTAIFHSFSKETRESPLFLLYFARTLSAVLIFLSTLILSGFHETPTKGKQLLSWIAVCAIVLASPFIQVHTQLVMVEPLLIFTSCFTLWSFYQYLRQGTGNGLCLFALSTFLIIMTKTNGLFVLVGITGSCLLFSRLDPANRARYLRSICVSACALVAGTMFFKLNPGLRGEANRVMGSHDFSFWALVERLSAYPGLGLYYLPFTGALVLFFGSWKFYRERRALDPRFLSLVVCLVLVSFCSGLATLISMDQGFPRYHLLTFFPWIILACLFLPRLLDHSGSKVFSVLFVVAGGVDFAFAMPAFLDVMKPPPRIHAGDQLQYYDKFTVESMKGLEWRLISENAEIYSMQPPFYMDGMVLRTILGIRETPLRLKRLPGSIDEINAIPCDANFSGTYIMVGNWAYPPDAQATLRGLEKIHDYSAATPEGLSFTLYRKTACSRNST